MDQTPLQARRGRGMGFSGCICVHPAQIAAVTRAYLPSDGELAIARAVLEAAEGELYKQLGVVELNGRMIDPPVVEQARRLLALVNG